MIDISETYLTKQKSQHRETKNLSHYHTKKKKKAKGGSAELIKENVKHYEAGNLQTERKQTTSI